MFKEILDKYEICGFFNCKPYESLKEKCNAPTQNCGICLNFIIIEENEFLIYIGASG